MKITGINPLQAVKAYADRQPEQKMDKEPDCQVKDAVEISPQARELQLLKTRYHEVSDVREERVLVIREQLNRGDYKIDLDELAANLLMEICPEVKSEG
ncbi:MAG: flagellar biosynthesis anti-sigma factor FlgM [Desulfitobacteriaceae bacterium]|nr:flagellar biosynthesis anti-sigma factor FlgM [Desulfitobacteriaceae bacterium]